MKIFRYFIFWCFFYAVGMVSLLAQNLDPNKKLSEYILDNWTTEEGVPTNTLSEIYQSDDGYIWISSLNEGLIRFNGARFETFNKKNLDFLNINAFSAITQDVFGNLWVGTYGEGLLRYKDGKFEKVKGFDNFIESLFMDGETIWLGTREGGLFRYQDKTFQHFPQWESLNDVIIFDMVKDKAGGMWVATEGKGITYIQDGKATQYTTQDGLLNDKVTELFVDDNNLLWIGTRVGLCTFDGQKFETKLDFEDFPISKIIQDNHKNLWIATQNGLFRQNTKDNSLEYLGEKEGLPHAYIEDIMLGKEGSLWITTYRAGLLRLKNGKFTNYTPTEGIASKSISTITELAPNHYLVGTDAGVINQIQDGKVSLYPLQTEITAKRVRKIYQDSKLNLWVGSYMGLLLQEPNGQETVFTTKNSPLPDNQIRVILEAKDGTLWIGTRSGGLLHGQLKNKQLVEIQLFNKQNGLGSSFIMSLEEDQQGNLLVGTNNGGLNRISPDGEITIWDTSKGLASNLIFNTHIGKDGAIWVACSGAVSRWKDGKFANYTSKEGLATDIPFDILEDAQNNLWITAGDGLIKVAKADFDAFDAKEITTLNSIRYTKNDGMVTSECTGATASLLASDGSFWIPTLGGITTIHPEKILQNHLKPPVFIERMSVDTKEVNLFESVSIEPGQHRFVFDFTALSYLAPENVEFQYKLEPYDKGWSSISTERRAIYTHIPYGDYTFQVKASNNDGIWNHEGASLEFYLEPFFYETKWFYALVILVLVVLIFSGLQFRTRQIRKQKERLEQLVEKRTSEIKEQNVELQANTEEIEAQKDKLQEAYNEMSVVTQLGRDVTATLKLEKIVSIVYQYAKDLMKVEGFGIGLYKKAEQVIEFRGYIEKGEELPFHTEVMRNENRFAVYCVKHQKEVFINDVQVEYAQYVKRIEFQVGELAHSLMYVPLIIEKECVGVISVQSFEKNAYTQRHLKFLEALGSFVSIALANSRAYQIIENKNRNITDSLRYAQTIQEAVLPNPQRLASHFQDIFILFRPRDIVSGDFYWMNEVDGKLFFAVVDCTGHGVPGAFMSLIGNTLLNEIVSGKHIHEPAAILEDLDNAVRISLKQEDNKNNDGMDVCLMVLERLDNEQISISFSGAKRPLFYYKKDETELLELQKNRRTIGGRYRPNRPFTSEQITLDKGDSIYMCTDGMTDQLSAEGIKFGTKNLKDLLFEHNHLPLASQQKQIENALDLHKLNSIQRDDITLIGLKL